MNEKELLINLLDNSYDIDILEIISLEKLNKKSINSIYKLKTNKNEYIIKIYSGDDNAKINKTIIIHSYLQRKLDTIPYLITNKSNNYLTNFKKSYLLIQEYIDGSHAKSDIKTLKSITESLAVMHKTLDGIPININKYEKWNYNSITQNFYKNKNHINSISDLNLRNLLKELFEIRGDKLTKIITKNYKNSPYIQFIHGDIRPSNVLISNEKKTFFLDFDFARPFDLLVDVGYAAILLSNFEEKKIFYFFENYYDQSEKFKKNSISIEQVFTNTLAYLLANNFPVMNLHKLEKSHIESIVKERIKMINMVSNFI